ncbi:hypothetical protein SAY87_013986 [Trapa incisa]|uniref:AT-hook motif nuclear-localized protein n=1 Tax=Trapa incisa TaxID=236973 RepID=A0AAN7JKR3_9MYRT|nr:hypothetical protein SAY87_013986 [Trapa incisa]
MDSRDNQQPPPHPPVSNMMAGTPAYPAATASSHTINNPNSAAVTSSMMMYNQHHHRPLQPRYPFMGPPSSEPLDSPVVSTGLYDTSSPSGFIIEPAKKKRGRPRKYAPEGNIALGLGPTSTPPSSGAAPGSLSTEPPAKKNKGRPSGSEKKQMDALGARGVGFTPHVIMVNAGEDIASKIVAFSQEGPRTVCILSANGAVCNVTLRQPSVPGAAATYEGQFEIISLTGTIQLPEGNSGYSRIGALHVSLAGSGGRVVGGGVAGMLIAATPVQIIAGSFVASKKKASLNALKSSVPSSTQQHQTQNCGTPSVTVSPPSQDGSSRSSDENGNGGSRMVRPTSGYYNEVSQPMHNMHLYNHLWADQGHR